MKVACFSLALTASLAAAAPCRADPALGGSVLVTSSHGQPFCADRGQLQALLRAGIAHAPHAYGAYAGCLYIPDNARVEVIQDLSPRSRYMHVVRARAYLLFGPVEAYTYSVGLYAPVNGIAVPPPVGLYP